MVEKKTLIISQIVTLWDGLYCILLIKIEQIKSICMVNEPIIDRMPRNLTRAISLFNIVISGRQIPVPTPIKNLPIKKMKYCFAVVCS